MNKIKIKVGQLNQHRSRRKSKFKKIMIGLSVILLLLIIFLMLVPHMIMDDQINQHVAFKEIHTADDFGLTAEKVLLTTQDGLQIVAYEVDIKAPKAMVIFLSGIHNPSVTAFFGHAKMLKENEYGSILLEMRAHGESDGDVIGLGYNEYLDTKAVVDYITEKYQEIPIIVYGLSMGAATAINSIGEFSEIDGLISLSAYSAFEDVFCDNIVNMGAPMIYANIQKPFVKLYLTFKYGLRSLNFNPKNQIKQLGARPALIIHSTEDSQIPLKSFTEIMKNAPDHVESWVREGDYHFIVRDESAFLNPLTDEEYSAKILDFLNKNFKQ